MCVYPHPLSIAPPPLHTLGFPLPCVLCALRSMRCVRVVVCVCCALRCVCCAFALCVLCVLTHYTMLVKTKIRVNWPKRGGRAQPGRRARSVDAYFCFYKHYKRDLGDKKLEKNFFSLSRFDHQKKIFFAFIFCIFGVYTPTFSVDLFSFFNLASYFC